MNTKPTESILGRTIKHTNHMLPKSSFCKFSPEELEKFNKIIEDALEEAYRLGYGTGWRTYQLFHETNRPDE